MNPSDLLALLQELLSHSRETEWIEFKQSWANPEDIGEYISTLANAAALCGKQAGYLIWGVEDQTRRIVGTDFRPRRAKKGNEELEGWLLRSLRPQVDLKIHEFQHQGHRLVIFEIPPASHYPVSFKGVEYIRIGSEKRRLQFHPEKERALWQVLSASAFEEQTTGYPLTSEEVLQRIDYPGCFQLLNYPLPDNRVGIIQRLQQERVIVCRDEDRYQITNLGAVLFARSLDDFDRLARKKLRVVQYRGKNRVRTQQEWVLESGYAVGFANAITYILNLLPRNEEIREAFRQEVPMFPQIAVRELVANALIHQDFSITGTGPMVEIFADRIEITNPGAPLIDTLRFIDEPPRSRNEKLASLMRRMNICEERGSGVDKVIHQVEIFQLPPPEFLKTENHTKAVLFAPRAFRQMDREARIRACYQHACLRYVSNEPMTNASFRKRLGIDQKNYAIVSRIIRDTIKKGLIRPVDPRTSKRYMKYVPFWA